MQDNFDLSPLKKKKKKINSGKKGGNFVRKVCKILNERFNTKEFSKTPGSGAYATTHTLPEHLKIYGDVITPEKFKYCIECKKGYNKENLNSILHYSSDLWKFIQQSDKDAEKSKKLSLLIIQQDRKPILAILKQEIAPEIENSIQFSDYMMCHLDDLLKESSNFWFNSA